MFDSLDGSTLEAVALVERATRISWRAEIALCAEQDVNRELKDGP